MSTYSNRLQPALQNLLLRVVWFFHPRLSCTTMQISADVQKITLDTSCMTISGGRTKQLDIFCRVTGFTSDLLSFIDVDLIRFFHGAIQLLVSTFRQQVGFSLVLAHFYFLGFGFDLLLDKNLSSVSVRSCSVPVLCRLC